jgi:hypothetical protein
MIHDIFNTITTLENTTVIVPNGVSRRGRSKISTFCYFPGFFLITTQYRSDIFLLHSRQLGIDPNRTRFLNSPFAEIEKLRYFIIVLGR